MRTPSRFRAAGLALIVAASLGVAAAAAGAQTDGSTTSTTAASGSPKVPSDLRDVRYCEIIPITTDGTNVTEHIFNTLGYNNCPHKKWKNLTTDDVNEEYGSPSSTLNGPRHWVIDVATSLGGESDSNTTFTFGGIETGLRGELTHPADQPDVGTQTYVVQEVARQTKWTYNKGSQIYELTDPDGNVYVMQSYSQQVDSKLTIKQLSKLGKKLELPTGWSYAARTLDDELDVVADGSAFIVNDEYRNTYQRKT